MKPASKRRLAWSSLFASTGLFFAFLAFGQVPQPGLTIAPVTGTNQVQVTITNGVPYVNYELFWCPLLANTNYSWQVLAVGDLGQTNFLVDSDVWSSMFFKVLAGTDLDGDGIPDWQDAGPNDPTIGILSITIDSPANGSTLN